jgi:hypothetical protein
MDFIYLYETELRNLAIALSGVGRGLMGRDNGDNVTNVQYKSIRNCCQSPHITNILIKSLLKKTLLTTPSKKKGKELAQGVVCLRC